MSRGHCHKMRCTLAPVFRRASASLLERPAIGERGACRELTFHRSGTRAVFPQRSSRIGLATDLLSLTHFALFGAARACARAYKFSTAYSYAWNKPDLCTAVTPNAVRCLLSSAYDRAAAHAQPYQPIRSAAIALTATVCHEHRKELASFSSITTQALSPRRKRLPEKCRFSRRVSTPSATWLARFGTSLDERGWRASAIPCEVIVARASSARRAIFVVIWCTRSASCQASKASVPPTAHALYRRY